MFEKKCRRCRKKIERSFDYCPYCGFNARKEEDEKDYGFLGKNDSIIPDFNMKMPFGLNGLFNSLLSQIDSEFKQLDREIGAEKSEKKLRMPINSSGISISISSGTGIKPEIKVQRFGPGFQPERRENPARIKNKEISEEKAREIAKLPREEAETKVRRIGSKIVYEINLPGVKELGDILINKLENSIEIKAFSNKKVYVKLLPVNLPILNYNLEDGKLVLELAGK